MINKTEKQSGEVILKSTDEDVKNATLINDISKKMSSNDKVQFEDNYIQHTNSTNNNDKKPINNNDKKPIHNNNDKKIIHNNNIDNNSTTRPKLKIIPLGGLNEIGKNMTVFEYGNDIVVLDCGLAFPTDEMLGVDLVIPDITYLEKNKEKVRAIVLTHGHEDHIGAIPYFLRKIQVPIYGTKLTLGLVKAKLIEHKLDKTTDFRYVKHRDIITIGKMKIEFIRVTHSIADASAIAITTPEGTVIHTGDFKVDFTPIDGEMIDLNRFAELGNQGVTLLMSDSTNVERPGYTMSEKNVGDEFDRIFLNCNKRIIVATFSSNIHRMQQVINTAVKCKRKVAVVGRSMVNVIKVGSELGYITAPEGTIIDIDKVGIYNPEQLVIITTGSQGEPMSALSRMAVGEHRKIAINPDDLVIFSSSAIPGNEKSINRVIDELEKLGAEVIYNQLADVHVSGHACQEELKLIHVLLKPKFFMPVHGEYRHLIQHGLLAEGLGMDSKNVFILETGQVLELSRNGARKNGIVPSGAIMIDGLGIGDVGNVVLRDRKHLAQDGIITVVVTIDKESINVLSGPDIISRGFVYERESRNLLNEATDVVKAELDKCIDKKITDSFIIKSNIKYSLGEFIYTKTRRKPIIIPIIMEI